MFDTIKSERNLLIIDDNPEVRKIFSNFFCSRYNCTEAESAETALGIVRAKKYSVILSNFNLPKLSGMEGISCIQSQSPSSVVVVIGGRISADDIIRVFRAGVFDYIQQPFKLSIIDRAVKRAFEQYELKCLKYNYQIHLEELAAQRAVELDKALEEIESSYRSTLKALVQALETRDFETHGHSERVVTFSLRLGYEIGLEKEALRNLELGALLHDIGKIGVPDAVLRKPAKLTDEEWEKMRLHPQHGQKILRNIAFLDGAARIVAQHHEKWDGSGYPAGLRGEQIDIGARIFSVVDAFDAMISDRVYRRGCSYEVALEELMRFAGTQFDPHVVEAFKRVPKQDWVILRERSLVERKELSSFQSVVAELVYSKPQFEMVH
jgi:response regulator RpfG family c-di-GMP phosphodiesterase